MENNEAGTPNGPSAHVISVELALVLLKELNSAVVPQKKCYVNSTTGHIDPTVKTRIKTQFITIYYFSNNI
jgi:hypothetical protein